MKRVIFGVVMVLMFTASSWAQQAGTDQTNAQHMQHMMQHGQMGEGMKGDMKCGMMGGDMGMQMCMPMMQGMMGHGMKMQEMLHMIRDMMKIQQRMLTTKMSDADRKQSGQELSRMMERVDKMLTDMQGMPMKGMMGMPPSDSQKPETQKKDEPQKSAPHKHH